MSCWRVLDLFDQPNDDQIPQLLIKPTFHSRSYTVHLTDLSNIWCEELGLHDIVHRASLQRSPIEVGKQDTAQLAILLDNVAKPLQNADGATCRITCNHEDGIVLHTSMALPEPLDCLTWKFYLQKRTSTTLKDELILPLLVSSHIQSERITNLIRTITSKDKAITRLVDHFDSTNMDLAAAFPSMGGIKAGRRLVKREQAVKHFPALQPFHEETWRQDTAQLSNSDLTTLGLFQEALAQSTPRVPEQLTSGKSESMWWTALPTKLILPKIPTKGKAKRPASPPTVERTPELSEDETEDEFDTPDNFKNRNLPQQSKVPEASRPGPLLQENDDYGNDSTEDEVDLDAPPKTHSHNQVQGVPRLERQISESSEQDPPPLATAPAATKAKTGSFHMGGKSREANCSPSPFLENTDTEEIMADALPTRESVLPSQQADTTTTPKKSRAPFRIGGKGRAGDGSTSQCATVASPSKRRTRATQSPTAEPPSSPPSLTAKREISPAQEVQEETSEEKAERKRAELKRRNEEAAKKQAQGKKKKKRF